MDALLFWQGARIPGRFLLLEDCLILQLVRAREISSVHTPHSLSFLVIEGSEAVPALVAHEFCTLAASH